MRSPSLAVLGFLLASAPALAGDVYSFTLSGQDPSLQDRTALDQGATKGRVLVDGRKYRLEFAPDPESTRPYQVVISKDGGEHETALNLENHTFFELKSDPSQPTSRLLGLLPVPYSQRSVGPWTLSTAKGTAPEAVAGTQALRHEIKLSYDIAVVLTPSSGAPKSKNRPETVRGKVNVEAVYWLAPGSTPVLPRLVRPEIRTGFPAVDTRLAAAIAALPGIAVKQQVTISTEGDRGTTPQSNVRTVVLENHQAKETKASLFEIPSGFKMQEPELSRPVLGGVPPG